MLSIEFTNIEQHMLDNNCFLWHFLFFTIFFITLLVWMITAFSVAWDYKILKRILIITSICIPALLSLWQWNYVDAQISLEKKKQEIANQSEVQHSIHETNIYGLYYDTRLYDDVELTFHTEGDYYDWRANGTIKEIDILIYEVKNDEGSTEFHKLDYNTDIIDIIVDNNEIPRIITNNYTQEAFDKKNAWTKYTIYLTEDMKYIFDKSFYCKEGK